MYPGGFSLRELLIFGKGLGRAIDNDFFNLTRALNASWSWVIRAWIPI
ncbi:hypothetical protein [Gemmobacter caeruleus]|nr:hypothetical protein [Gemmobacter caeruleus]